MAMTDMPLSQARDVADQVSRGIGISNPRLILRALVALETIDTVSEPTDSTRRVWLADQLRQLYLYDAPRALD
jgi:hypothetical protein